MWLILIRAPPRSHPRLSGVLGVALRVPEEARPGNGHRRQANWFPGRREAIGGPHSVRRPRPLSEFLCEREAVQLHCGCEGGSQNATRSWPSTGPSWPIGMRVRLAPSIPGSQHPMNERVAPTRPPVRNWAPPKNGTRMAKDVYPGAYGWTGSGRGRSGSRRS